MQKEVIGELKKARKHLEEESEVKKEIIKSFLEQWENGFHQLQYVKQEIQKLIRQTQTLIHKDLDELYKKEEETRKSPLEETFHKHKDKKEYKKHVKTIKKQLEKQLEKKKSEKQNISELIKHIEVLLSSGEIENAKKEIKKAEKEIIKIKDKDKKKILNYELQDLKTSIKLAEIAI